MTSSRNGYMHMKLVFRLIVHKIFQEILFKNHITREFFIFRNAMEMLEKGNYFWVIAYDTSQVSQIMKKYIDTDTIPGWVCHKLRKLKITYQAVSVTQLHIFQSNESNSHHLQLLDPSHIPEQGHSLFQEAIRTHRHAQPKK